MRLTCPNCGAQYEVPDDVIPDAGRDVQCSNCGDTWFQNHPDHTPVEEPDTETAETGLSDEGWDDGSPDADDPDEEDTPAPPAAPAASSPPPPSRRELDPAVSDVLRQEAEHEARARAAEGGGLETQPDLGLDDGDSDATRRSREAHDRMARLRGQPTDEAEPETPDVDPGARRTLLPDIEEINSSLRADDEDPDPADASADYPEVASGGGGFRRGFVLVVVLAAALWLLYVFAPQISVKVPALQAVLADYTGFVDGLRADLDGLVARLMQMAGGAAAS